MWKNQNIKMGDTQFIKSIAKDEKVMINNYDAAKKLLNHGEKSLDLHYKTFRDKLDLFFIDYDLIPLLVQESYLSSMQDSKSMEDIERMAEAADMISLGDVASIQIR
jgi:replication factor C subunit 1